MKGLQNRQDGSYPSKLALDWISKKQAPTICGQPHTHFSIRTKQKGWQLEDKENHTMQTQSRRKLI